MSGKMERQLASKGSLKVDTVGVSVMCGESLFHGPAECAPKGRFASGKMKTWLTDLKVVHSEDTCSWRFEELLRRQVQVTVERHTVCDTP